MKRLLPLIYIAILIFPVVSWADELDETTNALNQKQAELQKAKESLESAKKRETELAGGLTPLQAALNTAVAEVELKQAEVSATLADLDNQEQLLKRQKSLRDIRVRELYKKMFSDKANEVVSLLDAENLISFARLSAYQSQVLAEEERLILDLNNQVVTIDNKRTALQKELEGLDEQKKVAQQKVDNLRYQINLARNQQSGASGQIANLNKDITGLTQKQAEILAAKAAANSVSTTVGTAPPPTGVPPQSPSFDGSAYAFASYGAPHRVGMNQYGAYGRAQAGQSYQQILTTYYANTSIVNVDVPDNINVEGYGNIPFEANYLKGISEMPRYWPLEALKAQAIAARTYAMKHMQDNGSAICITEACQVYNGARINGTGSDDLRWYQAVSETQGQVLKSGGGLISAWYSSTNGGYTQSSNQVWNPNYTAPWTHVVKDYAGSWPNGAYDKDSPWFHKTWGDRRGSPQNPWPECNNYTGSGCNPWLSKTEMVQILNAAIKYQQTGDAGSIQADLSTFTSPITNFADIAFSHSDSSGQTTGIIVIGTNQGTVNIPGGAVFAAVNLKAPGTIELKSKLYDIIKY